MRLTTPVALSLLLLPLGGFAQDKLVESIEVRVTNVDVVVTDNKGNPVTGLTKDDFELLENKKPQKITNFYEAREEKNDVTVKATGEPSVAAPAAPPATEMPAELRRRRFLLFVDNYSMSGGTRKKVFESLEKFMDRSFTDGDQAMLVSWAGSLKVITPFTSDREKVRAGIREMGRLNAGASSLEFAKQQTKDRVRSMLAAAAASRNASGDVGPQMLSVVRAYADDVRNKEQELLTATRVMLSTLAGVEGRKVMVFAGAHLPEKPGLEMFQWVQQAVATSRYPLIMNPLSEGGYESVEKLLIDLASAANSAGVTLYTVDTLTSNETNVQETDFGDSVEEFANFTNTANSFNTLARLTGGVAITNTNDYNAAFTTIARDLSNYYSIGYSPSEEGGGNRSIVVRTKNRAYTVRSRRSYVQKTTEEQASDRVIANVFQEQQKSELPVTLAVGTPEKKGRDQYEVPFQVQIAPMLTMLPEGPQVVGGFTVYIVVGDKSGGLSDVTHTSRTIRIPAAAQKSVMSKPLIFNAAAMMRHGEQVLSVAVIDEVSHSGGFARATINNH